MDASSLRDSDTPNLMMNEGHPRSNSDFSSQLGDFSQPESILLENNDSFSPYISDEPFQPNNNPSQDGDTDFIKVSPHAFFKLRFPEFLRHFSGPVFKIWYFEITLDFLTFFKKNLKKPSGRARKVRR